MRNACFKGLFSVFIFSIPHKFFSFLYVQGVVPLFFLPFLDFSPCFLRIPTLIPNHYVIDVWIHHHDDGHISWQSFAVAAGKYWKKNERKEKTRANELAKKLNSRSINVNPRGTFRFKFEVVHYSFDSYLEWMKTLSTLRAMYLVVSFGFRIKKRGISNKNNLQLHFKREKVIYEFSCR